MLEISITKSAVNTEALAAELQAVLGTVSTGFSSGDGQIIVYLVDEATLEEQEQARAIVLAHDPTQLTSQQQALVEQKEKLEQLRSINENSLDLSLYEEASDPIRELAQKIAWLELEFRVGRGQ